VKPGVSLYYEGPGFTKYTARPPLTLMDCWPGNCCFYSGEGKISLA
jgi:hypothetical protein